MPDKDFLKHDPGQLLLARADAEELLPEFHGMTVFNVNAHDLSGKVGRYLVHELHRFHDAENRSFFDEIPYLDIGVCSRRRSAIKGADDRRGYVMKLVFLG